jgi:hypothetical protein
VATLLGLDSYRFWNSVNARLLDLASASNRVGPLPSLAVTAKDSSGGPGTGIGGSRPARDMLILTYPRGVSPFGGLGCHPAAIGFGSSVPQDNPFGACLRAAEEGCDGGNRCQRVLDPEEVTRG